MMKGFAGAAVMPMPGAPAKEKPPLHAYPEKTLNTTLVAHMGVDSTRRNGIHALADNVVLLAAGDLVLFVDYATGAIESFTGPEDGGVGAVAVHPSKKRFVVCEKSFSDPQVVMYEYPSKKKTHAMKGGATRGFSACAFNPDGSLLATVAAGPDFVITVWNWEKQSTVLRNKAFGSDIYSVMFSPFSESTIVTSGMGHIKLWSMADTFTGLKLQGTVGKFGKLEISDITGFCIFPDGKVLSGSESGSLLLWEGPFVKVEIMRRTDEVIATGPLDDAEAIEDETDDTNENSGNAGTGTAFGTNQTSTTVTPRNAPLAGADVDGGLVKSPRNPAATMNGTTTSTTTGAPTVRTTLSKCHDGDVEVVKLVEDGKVILTAGNDGYVRYWDAQQVDMAESDGVSLQVGVRMFAELFIGEGVRAKAITLAADRTHWVLLDAAGSLRTLPRWSYTQLVAPEMATAAPPQLQKPVVKFFSGAITAMAPSPTDNTIVVGGEDGTISLVDALDKKILYQLKLHAPVVDIQFLEACADATRQTFFCAFGNGSVRLAKKRKDGFELLGGWRPHSTRVVAMALDPTCTQLYTIAVDGTAFYFAINQKKDGGGGGATQGEEVRPIGQCKLPTIAANVLPTSASWTAEGDRCLVGFDNGDIIAILPPQHDIIPAGSETGYNFEVSYAGVGYRQKMKPPPKEKKMLPTGEMEASSSDDDDADEEDQGPWGVTFIQRLPEKCGGGFAIGIDKPELVYRYTGAIRYDGQVQPPPIPPTGVDPPGRVEEPLENLCFRDYTAVACALSPDASKIIIRCRDGHVLVRDLDKLAKGDVTHVRQYHDSVDGTVSGANFTFQNNLFITAGGDGVIVAQAIDGVPPPRVGEGVADAIPKLPTFDTERTASLAAPIEHPIEEQRILDEKQQAEEMAEGKRKQTLRKIQTVHKEYQAILDANDAAEGGKRLSDEELTLDPQLMEALEVEMLRRVDEAAVEFSWQIAYKQSLVDQLRSAYVDNLTYERFLLHSYDRGFSVASLRAPALTAEQQEKIQALQSLVEAHTGTHISLDNAEGIALAQVVSANDMDLEGSGCHTPNQSPAQPKARAGEAHFPDDDEDDERGPVLSPGSAALHGTGALGQSAFESHASTTPGLGKTAPKSLKSQLEKAEERKRERQELRTGLEDLLARKPRPTDEDPISEAAMKDAREQMGDYVLRTAPEYRVPPQLVPTAERKAKQLIILEHSIHHLRCQFNERLLALRDEKEGLCKQLNEDRARLVEIQSILKSADGEPPAPFGLRPEEEPEKRFDVSDDQLRKYAKDKMKAQKKEAAMQRAKKGFGSDLAQGDDDAGDSSDSDDDTNAHKRTSMGATGAQRESAALGRRPSLLTLKEKMEMELKHRLENVRMSELEEEEATMQREELLYERGRLLRRIQSITKRFDEKLMDIALERTKLESDLCMADLRSLLLFREYRMLLNFKKKDDELFDKYKLREKEQQEILDRANVLKHSVEETRAEQLRVGKSMGSVAEDAETFIVTNFPAAEHNYLRKVFARKIKRRKQLQDDIDDDDAPTSEDEDELDDVVDDFEEACPASCNEALWLQLLELREGKLDCEDADGDIRKKITALSTSLKQLDTKEKQVQKDLEASAKALEDFQLEKQHRLNLLETIVVLKLSQIQCLNEQGKVPHDYKEAPVVVFTERGINKLRHRIVELATDKGTLSDTAEALAREKQRLLRRKSRRQAEHSEWEQRVREVQLLKFGQPVDLEALESLAVDRETEELKHKLRIEEVKWERELRKQDSLVSSMRHQHQLRMGENTMLLKDLGGLREEQQGLEKGLTQSTQKVVGAMTGGSRVATAADRAQLKDLIVSQQQEIDMLRNEVGMLRRKGGHVYTPVMQRLGGTQTAGLPQPYSGTGSNATVGAPPSPTAVPLQHPHSAPQGTRPTGGGAPGGVLGAKAAAMKTGHAGVDPSFE